MKFWKCLALSGAVVVAAGFARADLTRPIVLDMAFCTKQGPLTMRLCTTGTLACPSTLACRPFTPPPPEGDGEAEETVYECSCLPLM